MTFYATTSICPTGDTEPPECYLGGVRNTLPVVIWGKGSDAEFQLILGNHNDPASYLRVLSERLESLALDVEVMQAQTGRAS